MRDSIYRGGERRRDAQIQYTGDRHRAMQAEIRASEDGEHFYASLSSDAPVRIWRDLEEKLVHTTDAIDLTRAAGGLPLLWQHDHQQPIGLVDQLSVGEGKLRGRFTFAPNAKAQEVKADVAAGMLRNVSIGYRVHKWIESDDGRLVEAIAWELLEASIVSVPADPSVGINRSDQGLPGSGVRVRTAGGTQDDPPSFSAGQELARRQGLEEGRRAEIERRNAIEAIFIGERFQAPEFQAIRLAALNDSRTVEWAKDELLRTLGAGAVPTAPGSTFSQSDRAPAGPHRGGAWSAGEDAVEKFMRGAELQILVRAGLETDRARVREAREGEYGGMTMAELAREFCLVRGLNIRGLTRDRIAGVALSYRSSVFNQVAADFPSLLENIANKALLIGYEEPGETWRAIARPGTLTDFKQTSRTGLSEFDDLDVVRGGAEYKVGKFSDRAEYIRLVSYGKLFRLTREAIVNDNLDEFSKVPRKMGRAASRTVGDVAYNAFLANPTLNQDGIALFHTSHANIVSAGNGPPSVAQLSTMKAMMGKQKDQSAQTNGLNIRMARLVVPLALQDAALVLQTAEDVRPTAASTFIEKNIHRGTFETVADARLDAVSATQYYGLADPNSNDVIEVGFLDGQQEPYLEQRDGWTIDGVEFKVRIDCAAIPLDFRTMTRNNG